MRTSRVPGQACAEVRSDHGDHDFSYFFPDRATPPTCGRRSLTGGAAAPGPVTREHLSHLGTAHAFYEDFQHNVAANKWTISTALWHTLRRSACGNQPMLVVSTQRDLFPENHADLTDYVFTTYGANQDISRVICDNEREVVMRIMHLDDVPLAEALCLGTVAYHPREFAQLLPAEASAYMREMQAVMTEVRPVLPGETTTTLTERAAPASLDAYETRLGTALQTDLRGPLADANWVRDNVKVGESEAPARNSPAPGERRALSVFRIHSNAPMIGDK